MDTDLLKTFLEVQRTRHFGKAAENLYLTQSAVSFRIRQLEQQLGVNLFVRYRNNIQLTPAGERLLPHAQTMLNALQRARQDVAFSSQERLSLSLGSTALLWDTLFRSSLQTLCQQLPDWNWRITSQHREQLSQLLLDHQLDVVLLLDQPKAEEIQCKVIGQFTLVAATRERHAAQQSTESLPQCYLDWGNTFAQLVQKKLPANATAQLHSGQWLAARDYMTQHTAWGYIPQSLVQQHQTSDSWYQLSSLPVITLPIYAAYHGDRPQPKALPRLLALLQQELEPIKLQSNTG